MCGSGLPKSDVANIRRRLKIRGRVQGVGFRPFVYRLATEMGLGGVVGNDSYGVFIEVEGPAEVVQEFSRRLTTELPPLAKISEIIKCSITLENNRGFVIASSFRGSHQEAEITPDVATCDDCLAELFDPSDRRYRYPFINCTNCGPRYSIVRAVPYDRPNTTMAQFTMCPVCQKEYDDPGNRRFHAQPNACPVCGPRVWLADRNGQELPGDAIRICADRLGAGSIVAIKGLGGFHLACRADDDHAMKLLRRRKSREAKPLAMMVPSLEAARQLAEIDEFSADVLTAASRPIVLLPKRRNARISRQVAPGSDYYGIMLPYAPLHHLLFAEGLGTLVMTSGNPSDEPLCSENDEALQRLADIADAFLLHDRDIERRVDDSVVLAKSGPNTKVMPIRRARGFVPAPIHVPVEAHEPVLAVGGELKSTVCILTGPNAVLSEHLGELPNARTYRNFVRTIEQFKNLLRTAPAIVAYDLHPNYVATRYAQRLGIPAIGVQHHHAHIVSCMAENGITGRVIGVSCDGTGYGTDGAVWGCEILTCDERDFERAGYMRYFPLFGGDLAAYETWRPAAGLLYETFGGDWPAVAPFAARRINAEALKVFGQRVAGPARLPLTSSLGRLFDAVAFLLGICDYNRYEAEAAMMLETWGRQYAKADTLAYSILKGDDPTRPMELDVRPLIRDLVENIAAGRSADALARAFHETVAAMLAEGVSRVAGRTDLERVVLSGGCFANRLLIERLTEICTTAGLEVLVHEKVPTGDGGLSLGQAVVAAQRSLSWSNR